MAHPKAALATAPVSGNQRGFDLSAKQVGPKPIEPRDVAQRAAILETAQRLGARLKRVGAIEWAGPCPVCGGRDRFSVNTRKAVWNCRNCAVGGDAIALVRHVLRLNFRAAVEWLGGEVAIRAPATARAPAPSSEPDHAKIGPALAMWRSARDPRGTPAEFYLNTRGLGIDRPIAGRVLRWHPGANALLALFRDVMSGAPRAVSRTFLTSDGRKIERKFLGPVGGAAIRFDAPSDMLTVAEGVETALTAQVIGMGPTWALGSAGAIAAFPILPGVARLRILIERDENGASERAAIACAERWRAARRVVVLQMPPRGCGDLNDLVRGDCP